MKNTMNKFLLGLMLVFTTQFVSAAETITYYHNDALGSPIAATDENGKILWKEDYHPYGERIRKQSTGTNQQWYTGKHHENDIGLTYFGARWYDPAIGRFMAIDPVGFKEGNIQSHNRYAYANNNPYLFVDPDGKFAITATVLAIAYLASYSEYGNAPDVGGGTFDRSTSEALLYAGSVPVGLGALSIGKNLLSSKSREQVTKSGVNDLLKAGRQADKNGLTKAGRGLQKHGDRSGSVFPKSTGNAAARNQQGQDVLEGILKSGNQTSRSNRFGGKDIFDNNTGRGARFDVDGNMKGFLEP